MGRKIKNYSTSAEVGGNDRWIGSDASAQNATMNFTPDRLSLYYARNGYVEPGRLSILLTYQDFNHDSKGVFNTTADPHATPVVLEIPNLTTVYVSKLDNNRIDQTIIWEYYKNGIIKIITPETYKASSFGIFTLKEVETYTENDNYLVLTLEHTAGPEFAKITPGDVVSLTPIGIPGSGGGINVVANPTEPATEELNTLEVGSTVYEIPVPPMEDVYYDDVIDIPIQRNRLVNIFTVTGTRGNVVPAGANAEFATITIRNDYIPGDDGSFTFIPDVTFQAYGFNALFSQVFTGSNLTEYITQIGNEAAGLSELITWDGVITTTLLNGEPASSITLDMGVTTPINSAFSVTGTNPEATVTNQSTGGTPPTSVTIMLGEVEVFSFNASALGVNDNNINFVGTTAATGINNITQFPVNWQAEYQNNTNQQEIVITSDVAGPQPTWSFVVNNNGVTGNDAGDIGFDGPTFDTVEANLINIVTFPDGTQQTTAAVNGGADGLSITDTDKLNLLEGDDVLATVTLPDDGGADGLSITDTDKLNLLEGDTVLATVTLPEDKPVYYDDIINRPIERLKTIETIVLAGNRSNTVDFVEGNNEFSTITIQNTFDSSGASTALNTTADITYTTSFSAAGQWHFGLSVGFSNGTTIADGTAWTALNNFYLSDLTLSGGTGIANQVDVGDVIRITIGSGSATFDVTESENSSIISHIRLNNARGIVGTINGIHTSSETISFTATVQTSAGASFSYTPDTAGLVYSSSVANGGFSDGDVTSSLTDIANAIVALETDITWDGTVTDNGDGTSSILIDLGTETNINSSFTLTGGINNAQTVVNTDGTPSAGNPIATTVTVRDGEDMEVTTFTASVPRTGDSDRDTVGQQIADAINTNVETPIDFTATWDGPTATLVLTADKVGITNLWTIDFNNNGVTGLIEGNLRVDGQVQGGEVVNQVNIISWPDGTSQTTAATGGADGDLFVDITKGGTFLDATGTKLPSGRDATDTRGNSTAKWNTIEYNGTTYYWIQEVGLPKASIIRIDNITDGSIVTSKTY